MRNRDHIVWDRLESTVWDTLLHGARYQLIRTDSLLNPLFILASEMKTYLLGEIQDAKS